MVSGSWVLQALTIRASWPGGHGHSRGRAMRQREWLADPNKQGWQRLSGMGEIDVRVAAGKREGSGPSQDQLFWLKTEVQKKW